MKILGIREVGMLGFFKKKKKSIYRKQLVSDEIRSKLQRTASMINMQSILVSDDKKTPVIFDEKFVRGYLFGFINGSLQYAEIEVESDELLLAAQCVGHENIEIELNVEDYVCESAANLDTEEFHRGQMIGGEDYFDFMNRKIMAPIRLSSYLNDK